MEPSVVFKQVWLHQDFNKEFKYYGIKNKFKSYYRDE